MRQDLRINVAAVTGRRGYVQREGALEMDESLSVQLEQGCFTYDRAAEIARWMSA